MPKLKSHKTVEQIAKKHRLDVSFIQKQLDMGEPIEHEHTKDHTLAMDIALQHLDEIPDYYTRLKKMEASAKKEHKKFKDANIEEAGSLHHWFKGSKSKDGKPGWVQSDGSPCANEPGETKTPKCFSSARLSALKAKGKKGESLIKSAVRRKREEDPGQQQKSGASKPTNVPTFAKGKKSKDYVKPEPGLKEAMNIKEANKDKPGKGSGTKDACYTKVKNRVKVWPSAYASGQLVQCRKAGASNWGTKSEEAMKEEQRYCPLCDKRETRSECSYGEKVWDKISVKDEEYSMARSELATMADAIKRLQMKVGKGEGNLEAWVQSKITKASDYIDTAADYINSREMEESFTINPTAHKVAAKRRKIEALTTSSNANEADVAKRKLGKTAELPKVKKEEKLVDKILGELQEEDPCWKGYRQAGMKKKGGKMVPNCVPSNGYKEEVFHERADFWHPDPEQDRKLGGPGANQRAREDRTSTSSQRKPDYSKTTKPGESYMDFAKRRASERMKENVTIEDANGKLQAEIIDLIKPDPIVSPKSTFMANNEIKEATRLQSETGNIIAVILSWRGKTYSIRMFFPQMGMPSKKDVTTEIQKVYPGALVLQYNVSGIQPGMPLIQVVNSKSKNYLLNNGTIGEEKIEEVAAWQRKEGKSKSGGLNEKGRKSYEKENPGSDLKRPQPEGGSRRDSFCARMKGMKKKLTSAKTANDPDSRINKSLRAWNC